MAARKDADIFEGDLFSSQTDCGVFRWESKKSSKKRLACEIVL